MTNPNQIFFEKNTLFQKITRCYIFFSFLNSLFTLYIESDWFDFVRKYVSSTH